MCVCVCVCVYYIVPPLRTELIYIEIENTNFCQQDCEQPGFQEYDHTPVVTRPTKWLAMTVL